MACPLMIRTQVKQQSETSERKMRHVALLVTVLSQKWITVATKGVLAWDWLTLLFFFAS